MPKISIGINSRPMKSQPFIYLMLPAGINSKAITKRIPTVNFEAAEIRSFINITPFIKLYKKKQTFSSVCFLFCLIIPEGNS